VDLFVNTRREFGINAQTLDTELNRGAKEDTRSATQVHDGGGQAVSRGSCLPQVLDRPRPLPAALLLVRRRYLIVVPRPLTAALLAVRGRYLIVVLGGADASFSRQSHDQAVGAPPALAAHSASTCAHVLDRSTQAGS
jgi:hypothetical protein